MKILKENQSGFIDVFQIVATYENDDGLYMGAYLGHLSMSYHIHIVCLLSLTLLGEHKITLP